jgi:hypothetical protein
MARILTGETVIVSTVPDETRSFPALTSLGGVPLDQTAQIRIGAFVGMSDDAILDMAATGGLTGINAAFSPFGATAFVGQGVDGDAGGFEVSFKDNDADFVSGEVISLLLQTQSGEFLIARFNGKLFQGQTETGLEPLQTLHLADAKPVTGNRIFPTGLTTAAAPPIGSYHSWITSFPAITDPDLRLAHADADGDGLSNFLEYATGGDPVTAGDSPACEIGPDGSGGMWVRFRRVSGLGAVRYTPQLSLAPATSWIDASPLVEPDPADASILRLQIVPPLDPFKFFRLLVETSD